MEARIRLLTEAWTFFIDLAAFGCSRTVKLNQSPLAESEIRGASRFIAPLQESLIELPGMFPLIVQSNDCLYRLAPARESALGDPPVEFLYQLLGNPDLDLCGGHAV